MKKLLAVAVVAAVSFASVGADVAVSPSGGPVTLPDGTVIATSYTTVRAGWNAVTAGATLWIDDGTYVIEPIAGSKDMLWTTKSFAVRSVKGAENTILDFRRTADSDSAKWCVSVGSAAGCTFDGLTIVNACCSADKAAMFGNIPSVCNCVFSNNWASTMGIIESDIAIVVSNCTFVANGKKSDGSNTQTYCVKNPLGKNPAVALIDCVFTNNVNSFKNNGKGGVFDLAGAGNQLIRCTIVDNKTCGQSGVGSESLIKDCVFKDNLNYWTEDVYAMGAGLRLTGEGNTLLNCVFTNNVGPQMAALMANVKNTTISDCVFVGNKSLSGSSAAFSVGANSIVRNVLIADNTGVSEPWAATFGGGSYLENLTVVGNRSTGNSGVALKGSAVDTWIYNCVFADNKTANGNSGHIYVPKPYGHYYNCHFDKDATTYISEDSTITTGDPKFVDAANGDYRPAQKSPLIDKGLNRDWMIGAKDLGKKNDRILGKCVDIGCYEFMPLGLILILW